MKFCLFSIILCFTLLPLHAQTINLGDSLKITFLELDQRINDPSECIVRIVFKNISNKAQYVYDTLREGYLKDRYRNVNLDVERKENEKYIPQMLYSYQNSNEFTLIDSLRHYDIHKTLLSSQQNDTLELDFHNLGVSFDSGNYRIKVNLRVQTIRDNTEYHDANFESPPPADKIKYISSKWLYFTVNRKLY